MARFWGRHVSAVSPLGHVGLSKYCLNELSGGQISSPEGVVVKTTVKMDLWFKLFNLNVRLVVVVIVFMSG